MFQLESFMKLLDFTYVFRIAMSESHVTSRPRTRATAKRSEQYSTQPIASIAEVRDKFEKPRGNFCKFKKSADDTIELEDDSFADVVASVRAFPIEHSYIGSPKHGPRPTPNAGTPIQELRARAASVRVALETSMPKPPIVPSDLEGREFA